MKVLMLTWEFPPLISGGLGMACYGMVKALLKQGTAVDLVLPTREAAYFPLRKAKDADDLPVVFPEREKGEGRLKRLPADELAELLDKRFPAYFTPLRRRRGGGGVFRNRPMPELLKAVLDILQDEYFLFRQAKSYTMMALNVAAGRDFDVIHAHDWMTYPAAMMLKHLSEKPFVAHVHSTEFDRACGPGDSRIHHIEYAGTSVADRVIAVSSYTANIVLSRYAAAETKMRVVHNAYTVGRAEGQRPRVFREPTVLFMGRITLQKGPDYFLEAARRVLRHNRNVRFVIAGTGDMEKQIIHRTALYGLGTRFLFAGFLNRDDVARLLSAADIFVLPSVSEPFGIAPLEAMSYGAVAIISKQAGVSEVIENAYKVDFWDVDRVASIILDLVQDAPKRAEIAQRAIQEVAGLRWEEAARKISDVYAEVTRPSTCST